jgi:chromate transporter
MKLILDMFFTFMKIGSLAFGGGYAMLPMLQREIVEKKHWATDEELMDYFALSQCLPGVISVNTATFVGRKNGGIAGGIIATFGVIFPSLIIIIGISALISSYSHLEVIRHAFAGIRACISILIINSVVKLWKGSVIDLPSFIIFVLVFLGSALTDFSPIVFVILAFIAGIIIKKLAVRGK